MATEINTHKNVVAPSAAQTARSQSEKRPEENQVQTANAIEMKGVTQNVMSPTKDEQNVSKEDLQNAVKELQESAKAQSRNLKFSVHEETGRTMVKVVDGDTEKVIRQIPSEVALDLAVRMQEGKGSLLEELA